MKIKITKQAEEKDIGETITPSEILELASMACDGFSLDIEGEEVSIEKYVNDGDLMHQASSSVIRFLKGKTSELQLIEEAMRLHFSSEISILLQNNDVRVKADE